MLSFFRRSLSIKILVPLCLTVMLAIGMLVLYVQHSTFSIIAAETFKGALDITANTAKTLSLFFRDQTVIAKLLAAGQRVGHALDGDTGGAITQFKGLVDSNPAIMEILVFDSQGIVVTGYKSSGDILTGLNLANRDYVKEILAGNVDVITKTVLKSRSSGDLTYGVAQPIKNTAGKILGGVAILGYWKRFTDEFISPITIGSEGYGFILDEDGHFIHHRDPSEIGKDVSQFAFVRAALEKKQGVIHYEWKGKEKILALTTEPSTGWVICMSGYVEDLASAATAQGNTVLLAGVGLILAVILVSLALLGFFVFKPIAKTVELAERTSQGDLDSEFLPGSSGDVIARMQQSLMGIRSTVTSMVRGFDDLAHSIQEGRFRARGKVDEYEGEYAELIDNANKVLDILVGLFDELPLPISSINSRFDIQFINKAGAMAGGSTPSGVEGGKCYDYFKSGDCRTDGCACRQAMDKREQIQAETQAHPGGGEMEIQYFGLPLLDADGKSIGAIEVIMDQTEIRQAHARMLDTAGQADDLAAQLSTASQELAVQVEQTTAGAQTQNEMTNEVSVAMLQMESTVTEIARNATDASTSANCMKQNAIQGEKVVNDVIEAIETVRTRAVVVDENVRILGTQAENIGQIMTVITDIADQTNLLALNAAIEAARAGEAGRGFAVVADEVRKLAEKTMDATHEVGDAVQAIQDGTRKNIDAVKKATEAIDSSTDLAAEAGKALRDILDGAEATTDQIQSIATASEEQATTNNQINRSVANVHEVATEIAEAMNGSTAAVTELAELADKLHEITVRIVA